MTIIHQESKSPGAHRSKSNRSPQRRSNRKPKRQSIWGSLLSVITSRSFLIGVLIVALLSIFVLRKIVRHSEVYHVDNVSFVEGFDVCGIDVSHHQDVIDWSRVSSALIGAKQVRFAIVKATEGTSLVDKYYFRNINLARENNIVTTAYHFYLPHRDAAEQARNFINNVELFDCDLPPVLDVERIGHATPEELRKGVLQWLTIVEEHYHVKPIIYANANYIANYLNTPAFDEYPLWVAHYETQQPNCHRSWRFWQFSEKGHVDGVPGYVDMNVFNGSLGDLMHMTIGSHQ